MRVRSVGRGSLAAVSCAGACCARLRRSCASTAVAAFCPFPSLSRFLAGSLSPPARFICTQAC